MLLSICAFVLALVAVGFAAAVWIISWHRMQAAEQWRSTTANNLRRMLASIVDEQKRTSALLREAEGATPAKLAAEVAALSEAVARLADTQRRFEGRFHAKLQHTKRSQDVTPNGDDVDDEIAAHLALQTAPPASPGRQ